PGEEGVRAGPAGGAGEARAGPARGRAAGGAAVAPLAAAWAEGAPAGTTTLCGRGALRCGRAPPGRAAVVCGADLCRPPRRGPVPGGAPVGGGRGGCVMYLSKLSTNLRDRGVRRDLANPYDLHRTLLRAFPDAEAGGAGRVL